MITLGKEDTVVLKNLERLETTSNAMEVLLFSKKSMKTENLNSEALTLRLWLILVKVLMMIMYHRK